MILFAGSQTRFRRLGRKGNTRDEKQLNNAGEHESFIVARSGPWLWTADTAPGRLLHLKRVILVGEHLAAYQRGAICWPVVSIESGASF